MKKILLIGTGGTIASVPTENGLAPGLSSETLLKLVPEIGSLCEVDCIQPISMDSTNIRPGHWIKLAEVIRESYDRYDGFVITHGTDTMAYTAAALSYMIQNSVKPIVCTGAQLPAGERNTDAVRNLVDSFIYVCDDLSHGVQIVFSGSVICGTRARKNYSKRFDAFGSINFPELARIQGGRILRFIVDDYKDEVKFAAGINPNVGILKLVPGMRRDVMGFLLECYDGLIIESFGVGGIPEYSDFYGDIDAAVKSGKLVVLTTQVPNEGSDISIYEVGNRLKKSGDVLEAYDMTVEAAFTKLMWVLGCGCSVEEKKRLFYTPIYHDILRTDNEA